MLRSEYQEVVRCEDLEEGVSMWGVGGNFKSPERISLACLGAP